MYYYGVYGNNDYRDYLAHYGRKGMKWGKNIFGSDQQYNTLSRQRATTDINATKRRLQELASSTKKSFNNTTGFAKYTVKSGINKYRVRGTGRSALETVGNAAKTAGVAVQYGALVAERAVADAVHYSYQALKQAKKKVMAFGKSVINKISGLGKSIWSKISGSAKGIAGWAKGAYDKGKNFVSGVFKKAGAVIKNTYNSAKTSVSNKATDIKKGVDKYKSSRAGGYSISTSVKNAARASSNSEKKRKRKALRNEINKTSYSN